MTLLIDPPNAPGHGRLWSHLASDTSYDELHAFASTLGLPRRGFDRDHYDIPASHYARVVAAGAVPVTSRVLVERLVGAGLRRRKAAPARVGVSPERPERLAAGDQVVVVAPAGPIAQERLDPGLEVLRAWGLQVRLADSVAGSHPDLPYLAASDQQRATELLAAWADPEVTAVFCVRGGYGSQRLVEALDWSLLADLPRAPVLVGFSDITALHLALAARLGVQTVHGPGVAGLAAGDQASRDHLHRLLFDGVAGLSLTPQPVAALVPGFAEGRLTGGNLALVAASAGTRDLAPAAGSVVVLEDVGEPAYRVDRMLTQLLRSGWFEGVAGLALGTFSGGPDPDLVRAVALDRLAPLGVPLLWGVAVGHGPTNLAFPYGGRARLVADEGQGTLTLL